MVSGHAIVGTSTYSGGYIDIRLIIDKSSNKEIFLGTIKAHEDIQDTYVYMGAIAGAFTYMAEQYLLANRNYLMGKR